MDEITLRLFVNTQVEARAKRLAEEIARLVLIVDVLIRRDISWPEPQSLSRAAASRTIATGS